MRGPVARTGSGTAGLSRYAALCVAAFTLLTGSAVLGAGESPLASPIANVFSRNEQPLKQYRAFRRMHAATDKGDHEGWMEAWTEFKDGRFSYEVASESGSDAVRGKVLRATLAREQELVNSGNSPKADLTAANYEFGEGSRESAGRQVVPIKTERSDVLLVDGHDVLDEGCE